MGTRLAQVIEILDDADDCGTAETAIDRGMEILYGGMKPLPSKGVPKTEDAHRAIGEAELRMAEALAEYARKGKCKEQRSRALDLKLFLEEMNEAAEAVGEVMRQCGVGDNLNQEPCDDLRRLLDEDTGHEIPAPQGPDTQDPALTDTKYKTDILHPSYSVKLRSPFVPPWFGTWEEDVVVTEPIETGSCVVVFKETKGLMLRLHLDRIIVVTDPWVATFGFPRGTKIPIWRLEWVPSEYVKQWNICNKAVTNSDGTLGNALEQTVTQRVKQDIPLNFFRRFYPKTR